MMDNDRFSILPFLFISEQYDFKTGIKLAALQ